MTNKHSSSLIKPTICFFSVLIVLIGFTPIQAVTRQEILDRAQSWAELTWYADSANTVAWDSMFTRYGCEDHLISDWEAGETYQGMAYSFGGNDDTVTYIRKLEEDSLAAGNHMCHYVGYGEETGIYPPDWAAGIDCSAFVCRCWGVPRTNTTGLYNNYYAIDKQDAEPGDILVKASSHTILIADPGPTPGIGTFALYEASGSACRVWYNPSASWSTYGSYYARSLFDPSGTSDPDTVPDTLRTEIVLESNLVKDQITFLFPNSLGRDLVNFEIYNAFGQRVYSGQVQAPQYEFRWQGEDNQGLKLPSGVYGLRVYYPQVLPAVRFTFLK